MVQLLTGWDKVQGGLRARGLPTGPADRGIASGRERGATCFGFPSFEGGVG